VLILSIFFNQLKISLTMKNDLKSLLSAENIQVLVADDMAVIKGGGKYKKKGSSKSSKSRSGHGHSGHGHGGHGHGGHGHGGHGHGSGWGGCRPRHCGC
jgi:hypothetical protein